MLCVCCGRLFGSWCAVLIGVHVLICCVACLYCLLCAACVVCVARHALCANR